MKGVLLVYFLTLEEVFIELYTYDLYHSFLCIIQQSQYLIIKK